MIQLAEQKQFQFSVTKAGLFCRIMLFCFCGIFLFSTHLYSQKDSINSDNFDEEISDSTKGSDSTAYYFNWKEFPNSRYVDEQLSSRVSTDSTVNKLKNDDDFWYVKSIEQFTKNGYRLQHDKKYRDSLRKENLLPPDEQVFNEETSSHWYSAAWFVNLMWTLIIAIFVAAIVYFLMSQKIGFFGKKAAKVSFEKSSTEEENLFDLPFDSLLATYESQHKYRLAIRILYLKTLQLLADKNWVSLHPNLTNTHYLQQMQSQPSFGLFAHITNHFDRVWYGEFAVSETVYQKIKTDFQNFQTQVSQS